MDTKFLQRCRDVSVSQKILEIHREHNVNESLSPETLNFAIIMASKNKSVYWDELKANIIHSYYNDKPEQLHTKELKRLSIMLSLSYWKLYRWFCASNTIPSIDEYFIIKNHFKL